MKRRPSLTAEEVAQQTEAFLAAGGEIDKRPIRQDRAVPDKWGGRVWADKPPRRHSWRSRGRPD